MGISAYFTEQKQERPWASRVTFSFIAIIFWKFVFAITWQPEGIFHNLFDFSFNSRGVFALLPVVAAIFTALPIAIYPIKYSVKKLALWGFVVGLLAGSVSFLLLPYIVILSVFASLVGPLLHNILDKFPRLSLLIVVLLLIPVVLLTFVGGELSKRVSFVIRNFEVYNCEFRQKKFGEALERCQERIESEFSVPPEDYEEAQQWCTEMRVMGLASFRFLDRGWYTSSETYQDTLERRIIPQCLKLVAKLHTGEIPRFPTCEIVTDSRNGQLYCD